MNLRLARVQMRGVGPSSARFDPLLVDFTNPAGQAEHAVLWLRNGGGKTTWERLIFHVLAWSEARRIGKQDASRPGGIEFLLTPDDVGHVVLEWVRDDAPDARRLITGLVCQLKPGSGHRRDEDGNLMRSRSDVERRFYCFHALPDMGLEAVADAQLSGGRRLSLRAFTKTLDELSDAHSRLNIETTAAVGEWTSMLEDRGLDTELFRYQVHMNEGEGGADQVIARAATNEQFIDFVLRAVTPPDDVVDVREQFERYREELAQMPMLRRRRAFVSGLRDAMSRLAAAHVAERTAAGALNEAEQAARALHGQVLAAADRDHGLAEAAQERQKQLRRERTDAETARKRHNEEAAWLEHWATEQRLTSVAAELDAVQGALVDANLNAAAWPLTEAVLGRRTADALAAQLDAALRERDDHAAPMRAQRDRYAAALRAAHLQVAARHDEAKNVADDGARLEKQEAERRDAAATHSQRAAATATLLMQQAQDQLATAKRTLAAALTEGLLGAGDSPTQARAALQESASQELLAAGRYDDEALDAAQQAADARDAQAAAEHAAAKASRRHDDARRSLDEHAAEHMAVAALAAIAELADEPDTDLHAAGDLVRAALRERISSIESELREADGELADARRNLEALADLRLLSPRKAVLRALDVLATADIEALSGWQYLNDAAPAAGRQRLLARHPHIADGVVLTDPEADSSHALVVLQRAGVMPTFPVAVAPADALLANGNPPAWTVWGGDEALYDETAAASRKLTLEHEAARLETRAAELAQTAEDARTAREQLDALLKRWPTHRREALSDELARAATDLAAAQARAEEAADTHAGAMAAERCARTSAKTARVAAEQHSARAEALRPAAEAEHVARDAEDQFDTQREVYDQAIADAHSHNAAAETCRERRDAAVTAAAEHGSAGAAARAAAAEVVAVATPPDPLLMTQPVAVLTEQLQLAQEQLDARSGDDELARQLDETRTTSKRHDRVLRSGRPEVVHRAQQLADRPEAASPDARARQAETSASTADVHDRRRRQLDEEKGSLRTRQDRVGRERTAPAQRPDTVDHAEELRRVAVADAGRQRATAEALDRRITELGDDYTAAERNAAVFRSLLDSRLEPMPGQEPYADTTDAATDDRASDRSTRDTLADQQQRCQRGVDDARRTVTARLRDPAASSAQDLVDKLGRTDEALLAPHADELTADLTTQQALIEERLGALDSDRELIARFLEPRVTEAISRLRALQRTSRLPPTLGAWADREFLSIRFDPPGDTARKRALVGKALDELLQSQGAPDGFKLLLHAVLTVLGRVRVSVLKPEPGLPSAQLIAVSGLSDFSGGERATIAILLYCALTNLRREALSKATASPPSARCCSTTRSARRQAASWSTSRCRLRPHSVCSSSTPRPSRTPTRLTASRCSCAYAIVKTSHGPCATSGTTASR